jgi:hypothetical protein
VISPDPLSPTLPNFFVYEDSGNIEDPDNYEPTTGEDILMEYSYD